MSMTDEQYLKQVEALVDAGEQAFESGDRDAGLICVRQLFKLMLAHGPEQRSVVSGIGNDAGLIVVLQRAIDLIEARFGRRPH